MKQHPFRVPIGFSLALLMLIGALLPLTASASPPLESSDLSGIFSDDFNRCTSELSQWEFYNPTEDPAVTLKTSGIGTNDAVVEMYVPGGETLNVNHNAVTAPHLLQPAADVDFEIEVQFNSGVTVNSQTQGILIAGATGDYLRFDIHSRGKVTETTRMYAAAISSSPTVTENIDFIGPTTIFPIGESPLQMRVNRQEDTWTVTYSNNNFVSSNTPMSFKWPDESKYPGVPFAVTKVGVFVGTSGDEPAHTAKVDYFFNTASRLDPEDGSAFKANVNPEGAGTVTLPELGDAQCNLQVSIKANANVGYVFDDWDGAATGAGNPKTVTFTGGQEVTANFIEKQYTLTTSIASGNGSVAPPTGQHDAGAVVNVTATPADGWLFASWGADVPAGKESDNPLTVTMDSNKSVTATFTKSDPVTIYLPIISGP